MIRLIQRRLIIPRGDTGSFSIPALALDNQGTAIFSIIDPLTQGKVFEKIAEIIEGKLKIQFSHSETVNLPVGSFVWDIKYYINPTIVNDVVVDGEEVNSYYAAFDLPICEIRQTGDNLLMSDKTPQATLAPNQIDYITAAINQIAANTTPISVSGSTPSIIAKSGLQYICEEVTRLNITLPESGVVDVIFDSGETATILTITPPVGTTVRWANGFDPTNLNTNTTYEIIIKNGLGKVTSWTQ